MLLDAKTCIDHISGAARLYCVWLLVENRRSGWLLASICVLFSAYNYWQIGFFLKSSSHLLKAALQCYAWYNWRTQDLQQQNKPDNLTQSQWYTSLLAIGGIVISLSYLEYINPGSKSMLNRALEIIAISSNLTALYWTAQRKIASWHAWICYDLIQAYIYTSHGLFSNGLVSLVYILFALRGLQKWQQPQQLQHPSHTAQP